MNETKLTSEFTLKMGSCVYYVLGNSLDEAVRDLANAEQCDPDDIQNLEIREVEVRYRPTA